MMSETQVDSTRVFVKGLPPSLTSDQLAVHFGKQYKVTDAHVFPERRIGFVGFHDTDSAQNAVNYFNRSYIRMSKISVDLARPVEVKRDTSGQAVPISKRKTPYPANDRRPRKEALQDPNSKELHKRKRDQQDDGELERADGAADKPMAELHGTRKTENDSIQEQDLQPEKDPASPELASTKASDNDWLRGKTSRLLDLVDPDDTSASHNSANDTAQLDPNLGEEHKSSDHADDKEDHDETKVQDVPNGRLFVRNLAFDVTDSDLGLRFGQFGKLQEAHVVKDPRKLTSKGLAFVQFSQSEEAGNALRCLDGVSFHGRLLHILPASDKRDQGLTDFDLSKMPLKKQKAIKRKMESTSATFSWNSLYMNPDAVISSIANRLGVSKSAILDPTSADAAVKQAHAETQLIAETKEYLRKRGISIDAFKNKQRDDRVILLKNFPFGTSERDLRELLEPVGDLSKFIFPPAGTMALVQFAEPYAATRALKQLAYKNIKGAVLYLEKAPRGVLDESIGSTENEAKAVDNNLDDQIVDTGNAATVFVRNLNFSTTTVRLTEVFGRLAGFMSARVKTRIDPKRPNEILSMGFGFVEFKNKGFADAAISALNGYKLDGHELIVKLSTKSSDLAEERRKEDAAKKTEANRTKIIIKNLPFQTSRKDVKSLFAPYGQLKTVRVPKKFDNTSRGFGFAEFVTAKEAQNAMDALSDTHLLGRRLVLEFTQEDEIDPEEQIQAMERKMEQQSNRIQLSKLAGTGRKKFILGAGEDDG